VSKMLEIDACVDCKYRLPCWNKCVKNEREIDCDIHRCIPLWCQLPDKPEPITEKFLDDVQYMRISKDLLVALINSHFLEAHDGKNT